MNIYTRRLFNEQQSNGSYLDNSMTESLFFTALILGCLNEVNGSDEVNAIKKGAADFILSKKNINWQFSENIAVNFFTLCALSKYNPEIIDGAVIADILTTLTSVESKEGGPYYSNTNKLDKKIDLVANIAIASFLSLHGVDLPDVSGLIETAIDDDNFQSNFCTVVYPVMYFISKFYNGSKKEQLIKKILNQRNQNEKWGNPLNNILAISSLVSLGFCDFKLLEEIEDLGNSEAGELLAAHPFFVGCGSSQMDSSVAVNVAFYIEVSACVNKKVKGSKVPMEEGKISTVDTKPNGDENKMMKLIIKTAEKRFVKLDGDIKNFAMLEIQKTIKGNSDKQMSLMALYFKNALGEKAEKISDNTIAEIGLANIFFWTAFIIYDDFWDEDDAANPKTLPTANLYARSFTSFFNTLLPINSGFNKFFCGVMDRLDTANTWETVHCRMNVVNAKFCIPKNLPDYGSYDFKYCPASGHVLGPVAMLYILGYKEDSSETKKLISYFKNYLIAMQINDDSHDWEEDLRRGHLSTVVVLLLRDFQEQYPDKKEIDINKDLLDLKKVFWFKTVITASRIAILHTDKSRQALKSMKILEDIGPLERLIIITEKVAKKVLNEQKKTADFLEKYNK